MNWKGREIDIINCAIVERQDKSPQNPWTESWLIWPSEERNQLIENSTKLKQTWKKSRYGSWWDQSRIRVPNDFSCNLRIGHAKQMLPDCLEMPCICHEFVGLDFFGLDLWDVVIEMLRSSNNTQKKPTNPAATQMTIDNIVMWKIQLDTADGVSSKRFCWWPWRFKINLKRKIVYFRKSHICSQKLDGQEANITASRLYGIRN